LWLASCGGVSEQAKPPALVVLLVVDQMRGDYLDRFDAEWRGGIRRLLDEGFVHTAAHHDFAITETACGHATLASGRFPRSHGVAGNKWFDRAERRVIESVEDPAYRLLGSPGTGRSAARFRGTSLASWLRQRWQESKVVSISRKDRSAIWLAGGVGEHIYWFDTTESRATSSTAFREELPDWVHEFNRENDVRDWVARTWSSELEPGRSYPGVREDDFEGENASRLGRVFPHALPADPAEALSRLTLTPWMDEWALELASRAVRSLELGGDDTPDLLALSLGATDEIGHLFGPYSVEIADQLLRLDRLLGSFLDELDRQVGLDRTLVVLVSDHGVAPVPPESRRRGHASARYVDMIALEQRIEQRLADEYGEADYLPGLRPLRFWFDHALLESKQIGLDVARSVAREEALATPGVARVLMPPELEPPPEAGADVILRLARRSFVADRVGDLLLVLEPFSVPSDIVDVTTHISPHPYDSHVPLILFGPGIEPARDDRRVSTVDLAPTLASILGLTPAESLDGEVLPGFR
jgi:predicted AlkP superfamily pyrophosphatase or phosphodiesterase